MAEREGCDPCARGLHDGSTILVNRGFADTDVIGSSGQFGQAGTWKEYPEWVTFEGVLEVPRDRGLASAEVPVLHPRTWFFWRLLASLWVLCMAFGERPLGLSVESLARARWAP